MIFYPMNVLKQNPGEEHDEKPLKLVDFATYFFWNSPQHHKFWPVQEFALYLSESESGPISLKCIETG